jgi:predicted Zn finger-like uncharacterized protein
MLTTRCPNCQTTFRITSVALHKAAGKVRCGQCSTVFTAFDSLTDTLTRIAAEDMLASTITEPTEPAPAPEPESTEPVPGEPIPAEPITAEPITAEQVAEVLEVEPPAPQTPWHPVEREPEPEVPGWRIAAAIAAFALVLQGVHHFRTTLAQAPWIGGVLERSYTLAGMPIAADVDPASFTIVNWVATAQSRDEAAEDTTGSLEISAGVRNTSDAPLPYPMLSLELTDRWEKTIGARVFTPDEYMGTRISNNARIRPNTTVTAQLQLLDPGPDAYGFEVDVCVAVDQQRMHCKQTDDPFQ